MSKIEEICKSNEWNEFLEKIRRLVEEKYIRTGEYLLSMTPYEYGIQVILRGADIKHWTPLSEYEGDPYYTTFKTRTIHIWWQELERYEN